MVALKGCLNILTFLLDNGAKPLPQSGKNMGPELLQAARSGRSEIVQLLVNRGYDSQGPESLPLASESWPSRAVKVLLDNGIPANVRNAKQQTALHTAVLGGAKFSWRDNSDSISLLIKYGADINAVDVEGKTAHTLAKELRYSNAIEVLSYAKLRKELRESGQLRD